jgi:hypothetical protein
MTITRLATLALVVGLAALPLPACDLDVPDLNNPGLDVLENAPTAVGVIAACNGLLIGNRRNQATENGFVNELGILGRDAYNFDTADNRYIGELLAGKLSRGSPFGGNFWGQPYSNLRLGNVVRHALDKVGPDLANGDRAGVRGFVNTIQADDLLEVIITHDTNGAVIDTDQPIVLPPAVQPLGAIVDKPTVFAEIARLLDAAVADLSAPDASFPFPFPAGYAGFDTPATFLQFNRALRARVAVYMSELDKTQYTVALDALGQSFINDKPPGPTTPAPDLDVGVFYTYTTKSGDVTNGLINPNLFVHPSVSAGATAGDDRLARKVVDAKNKDGSPKTGMGAGLSSTQVYTMYTSPSSPVPQIRNEELILLKAEALWFTGDKIGAMTALNLVRGVSGKLGPLGMPADDATFITELLYERRYSLLFEWGHHWIDLRRLGRTMELPLDDPKHFRNVRYPFPLAECNARPGEPRCTLGSTDP